MKTTYRPIIVIAVMTVILASLVLPSFAGTEGRKNTALALTAATVYSAFQRNKLPAVVLGLGAAQAWKSYEDSRKRDSDRYCYRYDRRDRYQRCDRDRRDRDDWKSKDHRPRGNAWGYYKHHRDD